MILSESNMLKACLGASSEKPRPESAQTIHETTCTNIDVNIRLMYIVFRRPIVVK